MTTPETVDLTGIGAHRPDHRRGYLVFTSLPDVEQRAEDSTAYADHEATDRGVPSATCTRAATATEKALLAHLGHTVPNDLRTVVRWLSNGVRNRSWPMLGITAKGVVE